MADYNPLGRTRAEREELCCSGKDSSGDATHSPTNWAEFELNVRDTMLELGDLLIKKHRDYGAKNISNSPYGATQGLVVRMWDKIARIVNLTKQGNTTAENEPLEDSFKDIANYGIIGLLVLRGKWDSGN
jgi:hypothetical protein